MQRPRNGPQKSLIIDLLSSARKALSPFVRSLVMVKSLRKFSQHNPRDALSSGPSSADWFIHTKVHEGASSPRIPLTLILLQRRQWHARLREFNFSAPEPREQSWTMSQQVSTEKGFLVNVRCPCSHSRVDTRTHSHGVPSTYSGSSHNRKTLPERPHFFESNPTVFAFSLPHEPL